MRSRGAVSPLPEGCKAFGLPGVHVPPEEAARIWGQLATGQWGVIAAMDQGGNRHVVLELRVSAVPIDWDRLDKRERRVVALASRGLSQKVIAIELRLSAATVSQVLRSVRDRFGFRCLSQLARAYRAHDDRPSLDPANVRSSSRAGRPFRSPWYRPDSRLPGGAPGRCRPCA